MVDIGTKEVGGTQDLEDTTSARTVLAKEQEGELYVGCVVVELEVVVDDGVVNVVGFDQVLECSGSFLWGFFNVDRLDRRQVELEGGSIAAR